MKPTFLLQMRKGPEALPCTCAGTTSILNPSEAPYWMRTHFDRVFTAAPYQFLSRRRT